jgi:cytidylate kinase
MNTVKIGDAFEVKSKKIIRKIIDNHELSIKEFKKSTKEEDDKEDKKVEDKK